MRKLTFGRGYRTNPLVWLAASLCAVVAVATILAAFAVIAVYTIHRPRLPSLRLSSARLLFLVLDPPSSLHVRLAITLTAENRNPRVHATLTGLRAFLRFRGAPVAELRAGPLEVPKNGTKTLQYSVEAEPVTVAEDAAAAVAAAAGAAQGAVDGFELEGKGRARWRVAGLLTVRLWAHLRCEMGFFAGNGTTSRLVCAS